MCIKNEQVSYVLIYGDKHDVGWCWCYCLLCIHYAWGVERRHTRRGVAYPLECKLENSAILMEECRFMITANFFVKTQNAFIMFII